MFPEDVFMNPCDGARRGFRLARQGRTSCWRLVGEKRPGESRSSSGDVYAINHPGRARRASRRREEHGDREYSKQAICLYGYGVGESTDTRAAFFHGLSDPSRLSLIEELARGDRRVT